MPVRFAARSAAGGGKRFRNSALAKYQNRKIFVSLIEKNFGGVLLRDIKKIFLFCSAVRRAETLGGIVALRATIKIQRQDFVQSKFGFCPKGTANQNFTNFHLPRRAPRGEAKNSFALYLTMFKLSL